MSKAIYNGFKCKGMCGTFNPQKISIDFELYDISYKIYSFLYQEIKEIKIDINELYRQKEIKNQLIMKEEIVVFQNYDLDKKKQKDFEFAVDYF